MLYNGNKCQLTILIHNQFNKRTTFWIISITWLLFFWNPVLYSFDIFGKTVFGLVGIKLILFFSHILIMEMFSFQF